MHANQELASVYKLSFHSGEREFKRVKLTWYFAWIRTVLKAENDFIFRPMRDFMIFKIRSDEHLDYPAILEIRSRGLYCILEPISGILPRRFLELCSSVPFSCKSSPPKSLSPIASHRSGSSLHQGQVSCFTCSHNVSFCPWS